MQRHKEWENIRSELTNFRKCFSLRQERMAQIFGIKNPKTISQWESGTRRPPESVLRLIRVLMRLRDHEALDLLAKIEHATVPANWKGHWRYNYSYRPRPPEEDYYI